MRDPEQKNVQRIGFVLIPNFALMSYASAAEPLRAANLIAGTDLYDAVPLSFGGEAVRSSSGIIVECQPLMSLGEWCSTIFVCAGGTPQDWA